MFVKIAKFLLFFVIVAFIISNLLNVNDFTKKCPQIENCQGKFDAIIAISGGKTSARTNHAVKLYNEKVASKLIFSGAAADPTSPSNAQQMKEQAQKSGVSPMNIITEDNAKNTAENAQFSAEIIKQNKFKRIILVTSGYHQWRASLEFEKALKNSGVEIVNSSTDSDPDWGQFWWVTPKGWWLAIKELAGIIRFFIGVN